MIVALLGFRRYTHTVQDDWIFPAFQDNAFYFGASKVETPERMLFMHGSSFV